MIRSAVLRLTLAYLAILMTLSLGFSYLIYNITSYELQRELEQPSTYQLVPSNIVLDLSRLRELRIDEARHHLLANLAMLNLGTMIVGSILSYGLAKRNIQPIEKALEAQSRFAADASHELRTPLTAMQTEIEVSLRDPKLKLKEAKNLLASNLEEVIKLRDLSDRLLRLARDDKSVELSKTSYKQAAIEAIDQVQSLAAKKKILIEDKTIDMKVMAHPQHLEDCLVILLDNAIKYSPSKSKIVVSTRKRVGYGMISVTDQGQGIKPTDLPHIFERFYRADHSRTHNKESGHGLGLSIAHKMVESLDGTIDAKSKLGEGSTFTIKLPLA